MLGTSDVVISDTGVAILDLQNWLNVNLLIELLEYLVINRL